MNAKRKTKTKMGRPPLPAGMQRTEQLNVRATKAERAMLEAEARRLGMTISDLLMRRWREGRKGR